MPKQCLTRKTICVLLCVLPYLIEIADLNMRYDPVVAYQSDFVGSRPACLINGHVHPIRKMTMYFGLRHATCMMQGTEETWLNDRSCM